MNKSLSETHPTLCKKEFEESDYFSDWKDTKINAVFERFTEDHSGYHPSHLVQSCCVDVTEHERALSAIAIEKAWSNEKEAEVERLKKELGEQSLLWAEHCNKAFLKGECRAMERVNSVLAKYEQPLYRPNWLIDILRAEFGIVKEEKR